MRFTGSRISRFHNGFPKTWKSIVKKRRYARKWFFLSLISQSVEILENRRECEPLVLSAIQTRLAHFTKFCEIDRMFSFSPGSACFPGERSGISLTVCFLFVGFLPFFLLAHTLLTESWTSSMRNRLTVIQNSLVTGNKYSTVLRSKRGRKWANERGTSCANERTNELETERANEWADERGAQF